MLHLFFEEAHKVCPQGPLDQYCGHWLFLQLRPMAVSKEDIFQSLTNILHKASDAYLGVDNDGEATKLLIDIHSFIPSKLYLVLNEAQIPAQLFGEAYRSADHPSIPQPILHEILSAWDQKGYRIVAGMGLSMREVEEVVDS